MKSRGTGPALLLALSVTRIALADPPPAEFTVSFDGDAAIWNPWQGFEACETATEQGLTATSCLFLDDVSCDGAGRCTCNVAFTFDGDIEGSLTGPCTAARLSCKSTPENPTDDRCKARLRFDVSGSISFPGGTCAAEIPNGVSNGFVASDGLYGGTGTGKLCVECGSRRLCQGISGDFDYPGNPPVSWDLTVQVAPDPENPNVLVGEASDTLGFEYTAKGKHDPKTDKSTISLTGAKDTPSEGAKVKLEALRCEAGQCTDGTATFKVQGNAVKDAPVGP